MASLCRPLDFPHLTTPNKKSKCDGCNTFCWYCLGSSCIEVKNCIEPYKVQKNEVRIKLLLCKAYNFAYYTLIIHTSFQAFQPLPNLQTFAGSLPKFPALAV
jgi:hypothetical protein